MRDAFVRVCFLGGRHCSQKVTTAQAAVLGLMCWLIDRHMKTFIWGLRYLDPFFFLPSPLSKQYSCLYHNKKTSLQGVVLGH